MHRQAINNSVFEDEQDIGKAISYWTNDYNPKHGIKASTVGLHKESIDVFT